MDILVDSLVGPRFVDKKTANKCREEDKPYEGKDREPINARVTPNNSLEAQGEDEEEYNRQERNARIKYEACKVEEEEAEKDYSRGKDDALYPKVRTRAHFKPALFNSLGNFLLNFTLFSHDV
jgi:hypothetical protein